VPAAELSGVKPLQRAGLTDMLVARILGLVTAGNLGAGEELQDHTTCPPPRGEWAK